MAKFTCAETKMILEPLLDLDRVMARRPTRKLILGQALVFKNLSYSVFKKHRKDGVWITREAHLVNDISVQAMRSEIMAIMGFNGARKSNYVVSTFIQEERFIFISKTSHKAYRACSCVISYLQGFSFAGITRYIVHFQSRSIYVRLILYASLINTNVFTSYAVVVIVVIATTVLFLKLLQISKYWKWLHYISAIKYALEAKLINEFKGAKCVKGNPEELSPGRPVRDTQISKLHNTTSAAPKPNWILIDKDALFTLDVYNIESFLISLAILLLWGVIYRLFIFVVRRFYSKDDRK
ncbi:hypothetical protein Pfo_020845 [Paulownia fortunei]|nr:hypothetical protein Pfo_020845 [Paulownia fortunei]